MSQIVSRNKRRDEFEVKKDQSWKKPFLIAFHGLSASTYGYAICWQNVSATSALLYARSNPVMRVFGKWRFLTFHCLVIQFVTYSLCLTSHFIPRLRRQKDFVFTTLAFPIGMVVCSTFWAVWFGAGREFIFPVSMEQFYPPWLNHITHTIIVPINMLELLATKHEYFSDKKSISTLFGYVMSYGSFLMFIRLQTGRFVYPYLNQMDAVPLGAYMVGTIVFTIIIYKSGKLLHDFYHGINTFRKNLFKRGGKKNH